MEEQIDHLFKVVVIGDTKVGKSNIISQLIREQFIEQHKSTIGVQFSTKTYDIDQKKIKCQIWDTAGQQRFRAITKAYYKNTVGAIVVFDITQPETFKNIERWIKQIQQFAKDVVIYVVGNKKDLQNMRQIASQQAMAFAAQNKYTYHEVSALTGEGISQIFLELNKEIYQRNVYGAGALP